MHPYLLFKVFYVLQFSLFGANQNFSFNKVFYVLLIQGFHFLLLNG